MENIRLARKKLRDAGGALLLAAALLCAARPAGALGFTGRVTAEDGVTGLNGVSVQAINPANDSVANSALTNGLGYYVLALAAGTYHLQVGPANYFPQLRSSHTVTTGDLTADFALQPSGEAFRDDCSANNWSMISKPSAGNMSSNGNVCDYYSNFLSSTAGNVYDWFERTGLNIPYAGNFVTLRHRLQILTGAPIQGSQLFFNTWNFTGVLSWTSDVPWTEESYTLGSRTNNTNLTGLQFVNDPADYVLPPSVWHSYIDYILIHSRDRGFVAGQVKNLSGTPLPYSRVQLLKGTAVVGEGLSDAAGNYTIWAATAAAPDAYSVFFSTNGTAQFQQTGVSVLGRALTTVNVSIDTAPPAAVTTLNYGVTGANSAQLTWLAPGDDGWSGTLNNSSFTIQYSTDPLQAWAPQLAQINISTSGVAPFSQQSFTVFGLAANATSYFRLWTRDAYGNFSGLSNGTTALTRIEQPQSVYIDEVSSWSITASVYASTISNLGYGAAAVNIATGTGYGAWTSTGNAWFAGADMGTARSGAAAAALGGKVYVIGGAPDAVNYSDVVEEYDPAANSWVTRSPMLTRRGGLAAAALGGRIYAVGGRNAGGLKNNNEEYDPAADTWTARAPMPTARDTLAAAALAGRVFAVGGSDLTGVPLDKNEAYDPARGAWETRQPLPSPRGSLAAAAGPDRLYAAGGTYIMAARGDVMRYDPWGNTWNTPAQLNWPRYGLALALLGGKLYAVGGYNGAYIPVTEVYDAGAGVLASAAPLPIPVMRERMAYAALGGVLYLAGGNSGGSYLKSSYRYDPGLSRAFRGLTPDTQYWFRAKARNQAGLETGETFTVSTYTLAVATLPLPGQPVFTGVTDSSMAVHWSSGTQASGFNSWSARYKVQLSTAPDFTGQNTAMLTASGPDIVFNGLSGKTTYYARVQAYNTAGFSDYAWAPLGSTRTQPSPLGGVIISSVSPYYAAENMNWSRATVRDSLGRLFHAYLKNYFGRNRVFLARSDDNGRNWSDTTAYPIEAAGDVPSANSYDQGSPALAIDSKDVLHLVWGGANTALDAAHPAETKCVYSSAPAPGAMWSPYVKIPAHSYGGSEYGFNIAVDGNDGLHVTWTGQDCGASLDCYQIRYSSRAASGSVWRAFEEPNYDGLQVTSPALAIDSKNGVHMLVRHAVISGAGIAPRILYSSRTSAGWSSWTTVYDAGAYPQGDPTLTIDAGGRLFAAWSGPDATYSNPQVKYSILPPGGNWSAMAYAGPEPAAPQRNPSAAADAIGKVYVLWSGSDTVNSAVNLKGSDYDGAAWKPIDKLTDETSGQQLYPALRWAGWRNNGGGIDVLWQSYDGAASTVVLRQMQGPDVPMSAGWTKTAWPKPAECGYTLNVRKDGAGDFYGIQQALAALPPEISTPSCVVVRDTETYNEQVTVQGYRMRSMDFPLARILVMADPTFVSSAPVVSPPPAVSTAAFQIMTDSVSVSGFNIVPLAPLSYGILASSDVVRISSVNVISGGRIGQAGIQISSYSAVHNSSVTVQAAYGVLLQGSRFSEVRNSTVTCSSFGHSAIQLWMATDNVLTGNIVFNPQSRALYLGFSGFNTVSRSTITGGGTSMALALDTSNSNTLDGNYIYSQTASGVGLSLNSRDNLIRLSTITAAAPGSPALGFFGGGASSNTVTASVISNSLGDGITITADSNTVTYVSATGSGTGSSGLYLNGASGNSVGHSQFSAPNGTGAQFAGNSAGNSVSYSSVTGGAYGGLLVQNSTGTSVDNCYLQGPAAGIEINGSSQTLVRGSVAVSTNTGGIAYMEWNGSGGVYLATSTLVTGPQGIGAWFDAGNGGKTEIASTTIQGGRYGVKFSTLGPGGFLYVSSLTFRGLSPGATAIDFGGGWFDTEIRRAFFDSPAMAVNVNARQLSPGSTVLMSYPEGRWGALYENDPYGYVRWPTAGAVLLSPADGAGFVAPAAALRARPEWGATSVKYRFQVDNSPNMNSWAGLPRYDFDQAQWQRFWDGAFSGQDSTMTAPGDSFLYTSTASFVFFSTQTNLGQNSAYYWRARALVPEAGEYGQWSATAAFTTGELSAGAPVNNLAVGGVTLSSPAAAGVSISFNLRENNVSTGTTPNGGAYNTADWLFVKFSTQAGADGTWNHATLSSATLNAGGTISVASDGKGAFLDHTAMAALWQSSVTLKWNYSADGVVGARARVKVFAISMVKVPTGSFVYNAGGVGGSVSNNYGGGSQMTVSNASQLPTGAPAGWPNGYNSFYIMRYELTQGQYADFLNSLETAKAYSLYDLNTDYGQNISYSPGAAYGTRYWAADRLAAKNYLSTSDAWSFLSWAALRPMTEMEFEKAGRDLAPDARPYPWGAADLDFDRYSPPNEGGVHTRNYANAGYVTGGLKVLDVGRYMSGDVYRTQEQTGASPYGIADLSGNVSEQVINCAFAGAPANGNGTTAWPLTWPADNGLEKGLRGSNWTYNITGYFKLSERSVAGWNNAIRTSYTGVRGVRAP